MVIGLVTTMPVMMVEGSVCRGSGGNEGGEDLDARVWGETNAVQGHEQDGRQGSMTLLSPVNPAMFCRYSFFQNPTLVASVLYAYIFFFNLLFQFVSCVICYAN